jgi:hypothetical protein
MKNLVTTQFHSDDIMLTACIWYANIDYSGLTDYALKALIGGIVWFGFKLVSDFISKKIKDKKNPEQ